MFKKRKIKAQSTSTKRSLDSSVESLDASAENDSPVALKKGRTSAIDKNFGMAKVIPDTTKEKKEAEGEKSKTSVDTDLRAGDSAVMEVKAPARMGTMKAAPQNIRTVTITDFQPDVCKDFLQTGYCGYGDTCKFLHIRDESKQKKPINKEWENVTKSSEDKKDSETIPFKCPLCKKDYESPVKTDCGHIFCKACFLYRFKQKKKSTCFICGKETDGVFFPVSSKRLEELLAQD